MVKQITLNIPDSALAESLVDCEIGEEKTLTFTVTSKTPGGLAGDVTNIEGYDSQEASEAEYEEEAPMRQGRHEEPMRRKMPKAIIMIGAGK